MKPLHWTTFTLLPLCLLLGCAEPVEEVPDEPVDVSCQTIDESQRLNGGIRLDGPCYELHGALLVTHGDLSIAPGTSVTIDGIITVRTALTLGAGTTLIFREGAGLDIDGGLLRADGSTDMDRPIRFIGAHHVPGYWQGLRFANTPVPSFNRLVNVEISHAARTTWIYRNSVTRANIFVDEGGRLEINDSLISDSAHHGISNIAGEIAGCRNISFDNINRHSSFTDPEATSCF